MAAAAAGVLQGALALLGMLCNGWALPTQPTDFVGARRGEQQLWGGVCQRASEVTGALCTRGAGEQCRAGCCSHICCCRYAALQRCRDTLAPAQRPDAALFKEACQTLCISC